MLVYRGFSKTVPLPTAVSIGNFDGVHLGHRALLARLREVATSAGLLTGALTFEPHPREFFSPQTAPVRLSTLREKLELIRDCGIDFTYVAHFNAAFATLSPKVFVEKLLVEVLKVKYLIVGDDFHFGARRQGDFAFLREAGKHFGFVVESVRSVISEGERVSSSAVRRALKEGKMARAAQLLGRPYTMHGQVVHGAGKARGFGVATANILIKHSTLPLQGVFAVKVSDVSGKIYQGVANIGFRPSVYAHARPVLEVHLFDFSGDLYGARLNVMFLHKIRDEMRFPDMKALETQIRCDVNAARDYFSI